MNAPTWLITTFWCQMRHLFDSIESNRPFVVLYGCFGPQSIEQNSESISHKSRKNTAQHSVQLQNQFAGYISCEKFENVGCRVIVKSRFQSQNQVHVSPCKQKNNSIYNREFVLPEDQITWYEWSERTRAETQLTLICTKCYYCLSAVILFANIFINKWIQFLQINNKIKWPSSW